jgi:hypothetical protein
MRVIDTPAGRLWQLGLIALAIVLTFLLLHPYGGLVHDGHLYTIQALNHLHPERYGNDLFLRFGSQDDFTLFSPLYAWAIAGIGIEPAAAVVTLLAMLLFVVGVWVLARTLMPIDQAGVALLLVLLIPAYYGPARVFHFLEGFVTPRQLSEALVILSLAAWLTSRRAVAVALAVGALLMHPIIGLAGPALLIVLQLVLPRWRQLWALALLATLLIALALTGWLPTHRWQFDAQWYQVVMNRTYLALGNWNNEDWGRVTTVFSTLVMAGVTLQGRQQCLAAAAFIATAILMLVTLLGGDLLHLVMVVQAQTWRALWLATVLAIVLLPPLYLGGWNATLLMRCALLLLAAAWAAPHGILALVAAPLAVVATACASHPLPIRQGRLLLWGCWAVLAVAIVHSLATLRLAMSENLVVVGSLPPFLQKLVLLGVSGVLPTLLVFCGGWLLWRFPARLMMMKTLATLALVAIISVSPSVARTWTTTQYGDALKESFQSWRGRIPVGSEVLWVDTQLESAAINTWLLLERPAFMTLTQAPNALFSRQAAIEMSERAGAVARVLPFSNPFGMKRRQKLKEPLLLEPICRNLAVRYVVTNHVLADARPIPPPAIARPPLSDSKLYICP